MTLSKVEEQVLGGIIANPTIVRELVDIITADDFQDIRYGQLFDHMVDMVNNGEVVNAITVDAKLADWGITGLDAFTGPIGWEVASYHTQNTIDCAQIVRSDAARRAGYQASEVFQSKLATSNPAEAVAWMRDKLEGIHDRATPNDLEAVSLREIQSIEVPPHDWVIPNLLERHERLVLTGIEGGGKTTLMRQIAITAAGGLTPFDLEEMEPANVLFIDAENTNVQWKREVDWMVNQTARYGQDPRDRFHIALPPRLDLTTERDLGRVHKLIDIYQPDIVGIGPLYKLIPRAITNDDDAAPLLVALDSIRARGVAMLMEAHAGHEKDAAGNRNPRPRGSAALLGWPEFGFGIRRDLYDESRFDLVKWRGNRDAERIWPAQMKRRGQRMPWEVTAWDTIE